MSAALLEKVGIRKLSEEEMAVVGGGLTSGQATGASIGAIAGFAAGLWAGGGVGAAGGTLAGWFAGCTAGGMLDGKSFSESSQSCAQFLQDKT